MYTINDKIGIIKTDEALNRTMLTLLESNNLENVKVSDLCEKAQINRVVFYAYFTDKYDLVSKLN